MLLIDGDQFLFKAAAAVEHEVRWDDQNHVLYANEEMAWNNLVGMIKRIRERFPEHEDMTRLCYSMGDNFRTKIDPTYKAHRDPRKPLCYAALKERMQEEWTCVAYAGLEADDVMGILATAPKAKGSIIVSADKDMKTVPATIWDGEHLVTYTEAEADYWHLYQTLVGDTSDGYKGCPGVGPVKAEKILGEASEIGMAVEPIRYPEGARVDDPRGVVITQEEAHLDIMWDAVVRAYEKKGLTEADALVQARLARILRWSDWDSKKKEPILWQPTPTPSK